MIPVKKTQTCLIQVSLKVFKVSSRRKIIWTFYDGGDVRILNSKLMRGDPLWYWIVFNRIEQFFLRDRACFTHHLSQLSLDYMCTNIVIIANFCKFKEWFVIVFEQCDLMAVVHNFWFGTQCKVKIYSWDVLKHSYLDDFCNIS